MGLPVRLTALQRVLCFICLLIVSSRGLIPRNYVRRLSWSKVSAALQLIPDPAAAVEVPMLIDCVAEHFRKYQSANSLDPRLLVDNLHILCKPGLYERSIQEKLRDATGVDTLQHLQQADDFLRNFVKAERKSRAKLKLNYILAGAESGRLDEAIQLLSETEEIDGDLLSYVRELAKEPQNSLSEAAAPTPAQSIFRMVASRLEAEVRLGNNKANVQLLARLLAERNYAERSRQLKLALKSVEEIDRFRAFVADGVAHLLQRPDTPAVTWEEGGKTATAAAAATLPPDTVEKMKDVLYDIDQLRETLATGLATQEDTFSSSLEDYVAGV